MNVNGCKYFQHRGIQFYTFSFTCTFMLDIILSDWPSAAICLTATKWNGILLGIFNLYCHTTNSDITGQQNKIGGMTFRTAFLYVLVCIHTCFFTSSSYMFLLLQGAARAACCKPSMKGRWHESRQAQAETSALRGTVPCCLSKESRADLLAVPNLSHESSYLQTSP